MEGGLCVAGHRIGEVPPQAGVAAGGVGEVQDGCDCVHDGEDRWQQCVDDSCMG